MSELVFRSCDEFTQYEFARWLETLPPNDVHHYELLDGFIVREPPAGWPHGQVGAEISHRLATFAHAHRAGWVLDASQGFDLPSGDTVEPDVSFVSHARWKSPAQPGAFLTVVPELVFEILAPSTARLDRCEKKRIYERNEVLEYVLVDSTSQTLERFWRGRGGFDPGQMFTTGEAFVSNALPGFRFRVDELFAGI